MSRFRKLSHSIWHCQYHIVWVPKYRYRILVGAVKEAAEGAIQAICGYAGCEVVELNVQPDHVHLVVMIPPKVSVSELLGRLKGQTSMKMFNQFRHFKKKPYWGNHFWAKGLLCGHSGFGCGHDTKVCPLSGEEGKAVGTATTLLRVIVAAQRGARLLWGQGLVPPMGGLIKAAPFGCGYLLVKSNYSKNKCLSSTYKVL